MSYTPLTPSIKLSVSNLYSVHYFEYTGSYAFAGEAHDFWEFLYVDKGQLHVTAGEQELVLSQGDMIFHEPGEFHALHADGIAPDLVVISFSCGSPEMEHFRGLLTRIGAVERSLLGRIVEESAGAFSTPLGDPETKQLIRNPNAPFGAEQLAAAALEELLIRLLRRRKEEQQASADVSPSPVMDSIRTYLERHIHENLTVEQISQGLLIGKSRLQNIVHTQTGCGVMELFSRMKIHMAQRMIREERLNFTEISAALGFSSVHHFSNRFRFFTGMSPSEYAGSVKMLTGLVHIKKDDSVHIL